MAKETLIVDLDAEMANRVRQYSREHGADVADVLNELIAALPVNGGCGNGGSAHQNGNGNGNGSATNRGDGALSSGSTFGGDRDEEWIQSLPPITRRLLGVARQGVDEDDYKEYLWQKYGR
ncbi:MAG TPA: hypothetical protein VGB24_04195 [Longimicrobium sp.]|uniref:hypothetical protein n=1 Tax=Longimicrobium sp. TaxID=2029185 RepID=UPI002EDB85D4